MELTFAQQSIAFLWSIVLGISMGLLYGVIKFIRFSFSLKKAVTFILDVFFMLICSFSMFLFSLGFIDGYVRFYVIAGTLFGFFLYRLTFGRIFCKLYVPVIRFCRRILNKILLKFKIFVKKLLKIATELLYNKSGKKDKFSISLNKGKKNETKQEKVERKKGSGDAAGDHRRRRRSKGSRAGQKA